MKLDTVSNFNFSPPACPARLFITAQRVSGSDLTRREMNSCRTEATRTVISFYLASFNSQPDFMIGELKAHSDAEHTKWKRVGRPWWA